MAGFFGEIDIDELPDNPNEIVDGDYYAEVHKAESGPTKNGDKFGLKIWFKITEGEYADAFPIMRWYEIPTPENPKKLTFQEKRAFATLQKVFISLGFAPDELNSVDDNALLKRTASIRVKNKPNQDGEMQANVIGVYPIVESSDDGLDEFVDPDGEGDDNDDSSFGDDDI